MKDEILKEKSIITAFDHILIKDVETNEIILNKRDNQTKVRKIENER